MLRIPRSRPLLGLLLASLALALPTPAALASEASTIIHRCAHGESLGGFSQQAYRKALRELSSVISEYTDCAELIHKAQLAGAGHHGGIGGSGPSSPGGGSGTPLALTPTEQLAVKSAHRGAGAPIDVGNKLITPGVVQADLASVNSLPAPLWAVLAFLLAAGAILAGRALRDRVRAHRAD